MTIHQQRLHDLRAELRAQGLNGYVVAHTDEHNSEYTPAYAERLSWLTGFDGSAGLGVVLLDKASIYVDGRYVLQVRAQVDGALYEYCSLKREAEARWISDNASAGARIGFDPWLHGEAWVTRTAEILGEAGIALVPVAENPIDRIWTDRPAPPAAAAVPHSVTLAGEDSASKRQRLAADLAADAVVITALDSVAWLLNMRGSDITHMPVALAFAILHKDGRVDLFMDPAKAGEDLRRHLGNEVTIQPKAAFEDGLKELSGKRVLVDKDGTPQAVIQILMDAGAEVVRGVDPCQLPKACKNRAELEGARAAHLRDGAALTRFLAWLAAEAPKGGLDELTAAERLHEFRRETGLLRDLSFDSISGAGPNGAIVHYRATPATNRPIEPGTLFLIDSGGQYDDGTTDVTRTIAIGPAGAEERDRFTRVLKGHIAIATARFPEGTTGAQLDVLARLPLWQVGLNYDHGTGHGVGSYLSVHEGPQRISPAGHAPLQPGMIVSNEPGYYKADAYGIRIENLLAVRPAEGLDGERAMLEFETLTLAPIDLDLVEPAMLEGTEREWLNAYHARVRTELLPLVDGATATWLATATRAI